MSRIMIERRYGPANRDWLCELTPTGTAWSGATTAITFLGYRIACCALKAVRRQAARWPGGVGFSFHLIHDRRHLRIYVESTDLPVPGRHHGDAP